MFEPRVAIASLSGESDAGWATAVEEYIGAAFLGGIAIDDETRSAATELVSRDRTEFLPRQPIKFIESELQKTADASFRTAVNIRSVTLPPIREAANTCRRYDAPIEINAHCRQDEMCAAGAGQALLRDPDRLTQQVHTAALAGAAVSVKVRAEVDGVNLVELAQRVSNAGAAMLHVDTMDSEEIIADITDVTDAFVIANNGVRDKETVHEYLDYGADAVSVGRASDNRVVLRQVRDANVEWFENEQPLSPRHIRDDCSHQ